MGDGRADRCLDLVGRRFTFLFSPLANRCVLPPWKAEVVHVAQLERERGGLGRLRYTLAQRPWLVAVCVLCVLLLALAAWLGVGQAASGGFDIERDADKVDQVDGDSPAAGADGEPVDATDGADETPTGGSSAADGRDEAVTVVVDVAGAVAAPAVVELPQDARVQDAIEAAGGLAPDADASGVNRAARLIDGQQVYIPRVGEAVSGAATAPATGSAADTGASGAGAAAGASGLVNINTADATALDALPGVGPSTAQAIIDEREANGAFTSPEDLMRVTGIGEKKFEKLRGSICV